MIESLLKPLQFRQETRLLSPVSDILVDFGVPKGGLKPRETTPGGADGHETVVKGIASSKPTGHGPFSIYRSTEIDRFDV